MPVHISLSCSKREMAGNICASRISCGIRARRPDGHSWFRRSAGCWISFVAVQGHLDNPRSVPFQTYYIRYERSSVFCSFPPGPATAGCPKLPLCLPAADFVQCLLPAFFSLVHHLVIPLLPSPGQAQCLVGEQLPDHAVACGDDGGSQNHAEGHQLWWDLLERAKALRDCVRYG